MAMGKITKYSIGILAAILVIYLSLDIQNLEKHRAASNTTKFNATDFASKFWDESLPQSIAEAQKINDVLKLLNENPQKAFESFGKKLGISKTHYFMVNGKGKIEQVADEYIVLALDENTKIKIATDFIYGNAVRDGSGKVNIDDFLNMTDFNAASVEINKLVKEKVVSRLRKSASVGQTLEFAGAFEIKEENVYLSSILVFPVSVKLYDGSAE
jgi:predicted lipoprotein